MDRTPTAADNRSAAAMLVRQSILPALRDLGVIVSVVEYPNGSVTINLALGAPADDDTGSAPTPPTVGTLSPGEAAALWHLSGGSPDAV